MPCSIHLDEHVMREIFEVTLGDSEPAQHMPHIGKMQIEHGPEREGPELPRKWHGRRALRLGRELASLARRGRVRGIHFVGLSRAAVSVTASWQIKSRQMTR